jgi:hypothetical protein
MGLALLGGRYLTAASRQQTVARGLAATDVGWIRRSLT